MGDGVRETDVVSGSRWPVCVAMLPLGAGSSEGVVEDSSGDLSRSGYWPLPAYSDRGHLPGWWRPVGLLIFRSVGLPGYWFLTSCLPACSDRGDLPGWWRPVGLLICRSVGLPGYWFLASCFFLSLVGFLGPNT